MFLEEKVFPAKLILMGEYSLLYGSSGLVLPLKKMFGQWEVSPEGLLDSSLLSLAHHLEQQKFPWLKTDHFKKDVLKGLFFKANFPQGMGLGSSGALTAAIFHRYGITSGQDNTPTFIRQLLSELEHYYHHTSSGVDPLVSYTQKPYLLEGLHSMEVVSIETITQWREKGLGVYLMPSFIPRKTSHLVESFRKFYQSSEFVSWVHREFVPRTNACVKSFISGEDHFFAEIKSLAHEQQKFLRDFFPDQVKESMAKLRGYEQVAVKLCGAGGGGYFLVFTQGVLPLEVVQLLREQLQAKSLWDLV
jgi:mevalonate kinase